MKIILFSDIHANLPALEVAFKKIDEQKPDAIYCLGDLVGYNIWPNEVIAEIRKRGIVTIAGNHDVKVKKLTPDELVSSEKNYAYAIIGESEKEYLATLPAHFRVEFQLCHGSLSLLLVHGSPSSNKEYLLQDKDEESFIEVFENSYADILCFGHTHKPYHRILNSPTNRGANHFRHAINTGSVGKPKDGNAEGCFVVLTINDNSTVLDRDSINVEFVRFEYDVEKSAKALEDSPLPNEYADMLRNGI